MTAPLRWSPISLALCAATVLGACTPRPNTGHAAVTDGVRFEYVLAPPASQAAPHTYRLRLALADAASGARIDDANVALVVSGPGYQGSDLVNLRRESGAYAGEIIMPARAAYRLTFQVNRKPPAASAVGFFETPPPV